MASISSILAARDTAATAAPNASGASNTATDPLANETTFLQLLVAQIKNQDPSQPMDSTAFLSQLAEFSQLEQLVGIRGDIEKTGSTALTQPASPATGS